MDCELFAGISVTDISPKKGLPLVGYPYYPRYNTGIHDPLYATCIVLDNGKSKIAIVAADICQFSKQMVKRIRKRAAQSTQILDENIILCASHTHSGPWTTNAVNFDDTKAGLFPDQDYLNDLEDKMVLLINEASLSTFKAKIGIEKGICGKEHGVGGNRRDPNGVCDPEVWVIGIQDLAGKWKACFAKYALHPTVLHDDCTLVSADYPCYIREYLKREKQGMEFLFGQGTSGNQSTRYFRKNQTFDEAKRIGYAIGKEINGILNRMNLSTYADLSVDTDEIYLEMRQLPEYADALRKVQVAEVELERLKQFHASYVEIQSADLNLLGAKVVLGFVEMQDKKIIGPLFENEQPVEIKVVTIGDSKIVFIQGEIFVEFGLEIKKRSNNTKTFVVTLANGTTAGYVCTADTYTAGGYEAGTSLFAADSGEKLVEACIKLLKKDLNK